MNDDIFCDRCGVVLDLHPYGVSPDEDWECDVADRKADLLSRFGLLMGEPQT